MYDISSDPLERTNLASPVYKRNAAQEKEFQRLRKKLDLIETERLKPLQLLRTIKLNATIATTSIDNALKYTDTGNVTGIPVGLGNITLNWLLNPKKGTATTKFAIQSFSGIIH